MQRRLFTLDEANRLVPWLEQTFRRAMDSYARMGELRSQLNEIQRERLRRNGTFSRHDELSAIQSQLQDVEKQLNDIVGEITAEGIIVRDISRGLVDFPSVREGREIYLCWIGGEETIAFWHETNRGFEHRQPL